MPINISAPLPYEIRIGVTGHRDVPDPEGVMQAVNALLDHIQRTFTNTAQFPRHDAHRSIKDILLTGLMRAAKLLWPALPQSSSFVPPDRRTPIEWTVISPLARGADRIVARAVMRRANARLKVVTPFLLDEYRKDFTAPADREEFEALLKLDAAPTELGAPVGDPDAAEPDSARRNDGYLRVGHRVVDACEILIAIWDGDPAAGLGGTGDIVEYALEQDRVVLWIDSKNPSAPPRLLLKRSQAGSHANLPTTPSGIPYRACPQTAQQLSPNFHRLVEYNADPGFDAVACEEVAQRNLRRLQGAAKLANFPDEGFQQWMLHFLPAYARADQLAIFYQRIYVRTAVALYLLAAVAVTVAAVQVVFLLSHLFILLEIIAIIAVLLLWAISKHERWHEKWLLDRHLAERIRLAMFTSLASLPSTVTRAHTELPFYPGPEGWMVDVVERLLSSSRFDPRLLPLDCLRRFLGETWIVDQANFHHRNAHRKHRATAWSHVVGVLLLAVTLCMAVLHWLDVGEPGLATFVIASLAIVLPAWGSAMYGIDVLRDHERIAARSKRMHQLLSAIAGRVARATTTDDLRKHLGQAARVMAAENHEWWVSLSYRGLSLPG